VNDAYTVTAAAFAPAVSIIAFQNSMTVGTVSGRVMRWNSNVSLQTMSHVSNERIYGTLYGKVLTKYDQPFPAGLDPASFSQPASLKTHYPELVNPKRDSGAKL
jgi:hypothetical protein